MEDKMNKLTLIMSIIFFCTASLFSQDTNQIKPITIEENTLELVVPTPGDSTNGTTETKVQSSPIFTSEVEATKSGLPHVFYIPSGFYFMSEKYFDYMHSAVPSGVYKDDQVPVLRNDDNNWSNDEKTGNIDVRIGGMKKIQILEDMYYVGKGERNKYNPGVSFQFCFYIAPGFNLPTFAINSQVPIKENYVRNNDGTGYNYLMPATVFDKEIKEAINKALEE